MSVRTECREAVNRLLEDPSLGAAGDHGVFTETDILVLASGDWSEAERYKAVRECNQLLGDMFRAREVCRYGPVTVPGVDTKDYMRISAKIAYGHPEEGPKQVKTPNGKFGRIMVRDDPVSRQGRNLGANRDDLVPWDQQDIRTMRSVPRQSNGSQLESLEADLAAAHARIAQLEREVNRLRSQRAVAKNKLPQRTADGVVALVNDLIAPLEAQVREITESLPRSA